MAYCTYTKFEVLLLFVLFLQLQMKVIQSDLYPRPYIPLPPWAPQLMISPENIKILSYFLQI